MQDLSVVRECTTAYVTFCVTHCRWVATMFFFFLKDCYQSCLARKTNRQLHLVSAVMGHCFWLRPQLWLSFLVAILAVSCTKDLCSICFHKPNECLIACTVQGKQTRHLVSRLTSGQYSRHRSFDFVVMDHVNIPHLPNLLLNWLRKMVHISSSLVDARCKT